MVATISPDPRLQFFANDGSFLVGGKLYTYAAGTTTPLTTYTTSTGLIANTNPIILDSRGEASVWFGTSKYKFVLKDANDVEIWTQDQLQGYANTDGSNAFGTWPISITGNAATATVATSVAPGAAVTSITGAGLYGFTLTGGPITSTGTLTVTPPAPSTAGNYMVSNGTSWVSQAFAGGSQLQDQLFTASGTWTAPAGVTKARVTVIAGGGAGSVTNGTIGGQGGIAIGVYTVTPSTAYTVTVGLGAANDSSVNGGTSSFGTLISATGGTGAGGSNGVGGAGASGTVSNSFSIGTYSNGVSTPFRGQQIYTSVTALAQVYTPALSLTQPGAGSQGDNGVYVTGGGSVGGIVYVEWIG